MTAIRRCFLITLLGVSVTLVFGCGGKAPSDNISGSPKSTESPQRSKERSPDTDPVVAVVGGLKIHLNEVLALSRDDEKSAKAVRPEDTLTDIRKKIRRNRLDEMIERRLLVLGSVEHPEWVSDVSCENEVQRRLADMGPTEVERRKKLAGFPTTDAFLKQFRRFVREELMKKALLRHEVGEKVHVSEEEVRKRYDEEKDTVFHRPVSWSVYHITHYLPREKKDRLPHLLEQLEGIRERVSKAIESATSLEEKGRLMVPFVRKDAEREDSGSGFAYLYDTPKAAFDPAFVSRVKTAVVGELSQVFELAGNEKRVGGCFFLVTETKKGEYAPYRRVRKTLRAQILDEKRKVLRENLSKNLRKRFPVTVFEDLLYKGLTGKPPEEASS